MFGEKCRLKRWQSQYYRLQARFTGWHLPNNLRIMEQREQEGRKHLFHGWLQHSMCSSENLNTAPGIQVIRWSLLVPWYLHHMMLNKEERWWKITIARKNCKWSNKSFTSRQRSILLINYVFAFYHILPCYALWLFVRLPTPIPCLPLASKFKNAVIKQLNLLNTEQLKVYRDDSFSTRLNHFGIYNFYNWHLLFSYTSPQFSWEDNWLQHQLTAPSHLTNLTRTCWQITLVRPLISSQEGNGVNLSPH